MQRVVLTFGLISGLVIAALIWIVGSVWNLDNVSIDWAEIIGYTTMLIGLSIVFFGIKSYRDNYNNGTITFWKGVKVGLLISVIAGLGYFAGSFSHYSANPDFYDKFCEKYKEATVAKMRAQGAPPEEQEKAAAEIDRMLKMVFENPFIFFAVAMLEIMPVGIIVTLISAALLRKREFLPAGE